MSTTLYRLSPSDFGYLLPECRHCYYQKVKYGIGHSGPFPGMFTMINTLLQNSIMGMNLSDIHPDLPSGIIDIQEGRLKSLPILGADDCFISGRFDILVRMDDGSYNLIDFKITSPEEEKIQKKYGSQLHAYKFALENPDNGKEPIKISRMGVISVKPEEMRVVKGRVVFTAMPTWHEVKIDMDSFFKLMKEISVLLNGDLPEPTPKCKLCIYRTHFMYPSVEDDLPF